jgi:hypothetical protein
MGSNSSTNAATPINGQAERRASASTGSFAGRQRTILLRRGLRWMIRVGAGGLTLAAVAASVASAAATPGAERFLPDAKGQRIALRAVFHQRDFPSESGWADLELSIPGVQLDPCGRRVDDLVLTGYALSAFSRGATPATESAMVLISNADVFATRRMLDRYVGRTLAGNALACLRARVQRRATHGSRYVSFQAVQMSRLAPMQRAFRITFYPPYSTALWEEDAVFLARGRTLAVVSASSPLSARDRSAKLEYFRRIAQRIPT